jgi:signal transduction histidine kinase
MMTVKTFLFLFCYLSSYLLYAQRQELDSLHKIISKFQQDKAYATDTNYIKQLHILATRYVYINPDSSLLLGQTIKKLSQAIHYRKGYLYALTVTISGRQAQGLNYTNKALFDETLQLAKELGEKSIEARTYNQMAALGRDAGESKEVILGLYEKSLAIRKALNETKGIISCLHNIGLTHATLGDYTQAMRYYLEVLKLSEKAHNQEHQAHVFLSIAELYAKQHKDSAALQYYAKAQKIFEKIENKRGLGIILNELGDMAQRKGNYQEAFDYYQSSLALRKSIKEHKGIAYSYSSLGRHYQEQGHQSHAVAYYALAIRIKDSIHDISELPQDYKGIGQCFLELHDYKNALQYTQKGLEVARKIALKARIRDCSEILSQVHKATKQYDSALWYHEQFKLYADSLNNQDVERNIAQLQAKYEFEKKEEILSHEYEVDKKLHLLSIFFVLAVLLVVSLFAAYIHRSRQKLQKSYDNLTLANTTILSQAEALMQQANELAATNQTKDKLFAIIGHDLKSPIASLLGLLNLLSSQSISQEEFVELAEHIEQNLTQVHFTLNNLLEWAKTQLKGIQTNPQKIILKELATENTSLLEEIALNKGITLVNNMPNSVAMWADKEQINLVFRNLLSNAIKFSQRGDTVSISAQIHTDNYWLITVKDTGVGMSAETTQQLFDVPHSTYGTSGEKGTGLGLTLCKDFVSRNGGKIWVESELGKGTTFFFTVPQNPA